MRKFNRLLTITVISFLALSFIVGPLLYNFASPATARWVMKRVFLQGSTVLIALLFVSLLATMWESLTEKSSKESDQR